HPYEDQPLCCRRLCEASFHCRNQLKSADRESEVLRAALAGLSLSPQSDRSVRKACHFALSLAVPQGSCRHHRPWLWQCWLRVREIVFALQIPAAAPRCPIELE